MAGVVASREIPVAHQRVWVALADLASHVEWMADARSIEFLDEQTSGVGTRMAVMTVVGPFRTLDLLEVVGWEEGHAIDVVHRGLVRGRGRISARSSGDGTLVTWEESLAFPWWLGGPVTAWLVRPVLAAVWARNLRRLEETLTAP